MKLKVGDRVKATRAYFNYPFSDQSIKGLVGRVHSIQQAVWVNFSQRIGLYRFPKWEHLKKI
jgi:hypothetical protein